MNIGDVARRSGVTAKTIRYYESVGLIPQPPRTVSGYRAYEEDDLQILRFVQRARSLGFSVKDVANLLALYTDKSRSSADVKALAARHVRRIEQKIVELESIRGTLLDLMERCHGDDRPDCPILDDLAAGEPGSDRAAVGYRS